MQFTTRLNRGWAFPIGAAVLASMLVLVAWFGISGRWQDSQPKMATDSEFIPMYGSVEELSAASEVVVLGTVTRLAGKEVDYGTSGEDKGIPLTFHEVDVHEALKGETGGTIVVVTEDTENSDVRNLTPLRVGETVILFLVDRTPEDNLTVTSFNHFYLPIALDNSVFDAVGEGAFRPRTPELFAEETFDLADIRHATDR